METLNNVRLPACKHQFSYWGLDDIFYNSKLKYSIRNLSFGRNFTMEVTIEALNKSLLVCNLLGIDGRHHFKKIYIYNSKLDIIEIDWLLSKIGLNLLIMQYPSPNKAMARWLWELASL